MDIERRISLATARKRGILDPLAGKEIGVFRQSPPGTPAHFGERAYWFGTALGLAKAVTALERRGGDALFPDLEPARPATWYTTMYRLPRSAFPSGLRLRTTHAFCRSKGQVACGVAA